MLGRLATPGAPGGAPHKSLNVRDVFIETSDSLRRWRQEVRDGCARTRGTAVSCLSAPLCERAKCGADVAIARAVCRFARAQHEVVTQPFAGMKIFTCRYCKKEFNKTKQTVTNHEYRRREIQFNDECKCARRAAARAAGSGS